MADMQNDYLRRLKPLLVIAGFLALVTVASPCDPRSDGQRCPTRRVGVISAGDVPGFHLAAEQDVPVQPSDPLLGAWQRTLAADDVAGTGRETISVVLMVPKAAVGSGPAAIVNGGSVFSNLDGVTNLN